MHESEVAFFPSGQIRVESKRWGGYQKSVQETWELGLFALCSGAQNLIIGLAKITEKPFYVLCPRWRSLSLACSLPLLLTLIFERKASVWSSSSLVLKALWLYFGLGDQLAVDKRNEDSYWADESVCLLAKPGNQTRISKRIDDSRFQSSVSGIKID